MPSSILAGQYPHTCCGDTSERYEIRDPGWMAIASVHGMRLADAGARFRRLYDYGAEPLSPVRARAPDATAPLLSHNMRCVLDRDFSHHRSGNWDAWTRRDLQGRPVWKAYLCPRFADLARLELRIGDLLTDRRVAAFKTVAQRWMALRPDKFIVYFEDPRARAGWITRALPHLAGLAANPVPFTRPVSGCDLVTIATDPVEAPGQSWRSSLLRRVSEMIAPDAPLVVADLRRGLRQAGIDPNKWESTDAPQI